MAEDTSSISDAAAVADLAAALSELDTPEACQRFLVDLCSPAELGALARRWEVARRLNRQEPYRSISEATGVSTATVTRVAAALTGSQGGYRLALACRERGSKASTTWHRSDSPEQAEERGTPAPSVRRRV
mgnify:CR=1 FL=1